VVLAGLAARLAGFGRQGFWNDEAWVALSTRVEGLAQFWLSLSVTPPLWAAGLRALALLPGPPDVALRMLPLGFGLATLWAAHRTGTAFAGHASGGFLAAAALAQDPLSIAYSRELKPYTAEAFFCVLALWLGLRCAARRRGGGLAALCVVLVGGFLFANAQLLVAPAVLGALLVDAVARRERRWGMAVAAAAATVGALAILYFRLGVAPRLPPSLAQYWQGAQLPAEASWQNAAFAWRRLRGLLALTWGEVMTTVTLVALGTAAALDARARVGLVSLALLTAACLGVSATRTLPLEPRILHFLLTAASTLGAASLGLLAVRLWACRPLRPLVGAALGVAAVAVAVQAERRVFTHRPEDLGLLVRRMEALRRPGDGVLLYERSGLVYAFYARRTPVLVPDPALTIGFRPRLDDPAVTVVGRDGAEPAAARALARGERAWFVGSRFRDDDEDVIRRALDAQADVLLEERRPGALLLLLAPRPPRPPR
jgi:hypothetical protein